MKRLTPIYVMAMLGAFAHGALAFQEGAPSAPSSPPSASSPKAQAPKAVDPGKGLSLRTPELSVGKGSGTEVRVPGIRQGRRAAEAGFRP